MTEEIRPERVVGGNGNRDGGPPPSGLSEPGTDFHAVVNKPIAGTQIQLNLTARLLSRLNSWSWTLSSEAERRQRS